MAREGWRHVLLEDVAAEITVGHVGPMASEYVADGIPFLRSQNVEPFRVVDSDIKFITPSFHRRLRKSALSPGDVVIVRTGKPGACTVIPISIPVANCSDLVIVRCGPELDPYFLAYYVNSIAAHHVDAHLVGAVQQHFNVGSARKMLLHVPSLAEQSSVVRILGALDDKIELNRRMNETLEGMARALFKSWFVDFDPVPAGWQWEPLLQQASLISGGTPKTGAVEYWNGDVFWASAKDVSQRRDAFLISTERTITERGLLESATRMVPKFSTVVVARGATTGRFCLLGRDMAMNQTCYALHSAKRRPFWLANAFAHLVDGLVHAAHGSVFDTITTRTLEGASVLVAPDQTMDQFEAKIAPIYQRILLNCEQSRTLSQIHDLLLPKLISGELRVGEAQRVVAGAAA